jgi:hypothetical protein
MGREARRSPLLGMLSTRGITGRVPVGIDSATPDTSSRITGRVPVGIDSATPDTSSRITGRVCVGIDSATPDTSSRITGRVCVKVRLSIDYCHKTEQNYSDDQDIDFHFDTPRLVTVLINTPSFFFRVKMIFPELVDTELSGIMPPFEFGRTAKPQG